MPYTTSGSTYEAVCRAIRWRAEITPIEVMPRGNKVYVNGTLLKPDEWRELARWNGHEMDDGREIVISRDSLRTARQC